MARLLRTATRTVMAVFAGLAAGMASAQTVAAPEADPPVSLSAAQRLFYSGDYEAAAAMALRLRESAPDDLATYELRTSALHLLIRRRLAALGGRSDALGACDSCAGLIATITADTAHARQLAHARLKRDDHDLDALFFLGKIDLTHVWLHLDTLGQKTGWNEYWEARHSLDAVLAIDPGRVRARVARAWIDYIVDTRVPHGLRWVLGGGSTTRALANARAAAATPSDAFSTAEAKFGLWDMLVRHGDIAAATVVAADLSERFPENRELLTFLAAHRPPAAP